MINHFDIRILKSSILGFIIQKRFTVLWFLATLLIAQLFFYLLVKFLKNNCNRILLISTIIAVVTICICNLYKTPIVWNIETSFVVLLYLGLGYYIKSNKLFDNKKYKTKLFYLITFLITSIVFFVTNRMLGFEMFEMYAQWYGNPILTIPCSITGSLFVIILSTYLEDNKILNYF